MSSSRTGRKPISDETQAAVLTKSRRRCCICYGLQRDAELKQGQIAHVDRDSGNPEEANLAFLCFDHHDLYDSTTRQSKNITKAELLIYRKELYEHMEDIMERASMSPILVQLLRMIAR